jgi:N-methylhydantoinase A
LSCENLHNNQREASIMGVRVGADIGGTFTDVVLEDGPHRFSVKVPTTRTHPEQGVLDAVTRALHAAGRTLPDVDLLIHGTTLATNALIERKYARTALLTTEGFRDIVEMGNEGRFDQYDLRAVKPQPLVPRHLRFTVSERLRHDGSIIKPLQIADVIVAAHKMAAASVQSVGITFLHAYANETHECDARRLILDILPDISVSVSHEVSPEMREYERVSTTLANACLQPIMSEYLLRLQEALRQGGLAGPMLMILSSGSLTTVETASRFPIRLLESGPAGGAIFACTIARQLGLKDVLSFDVGGTTAKFCMIDDGEARQALDFEVARTYRFKKGSGIPVRVPVVDLVEIGAGGGSIARLDSVGRVTVGPDSAGSEPGPACYARGGTLPTVTDCDLVVGKLDPQAFAGGTMRLDTVAAGNALGQSFEAAGYTNENAAYAVTEVVTDSMAAAARVHAAEVGVALDRRTVIAFGGAAPLHAARFAEKLGINAIVVPEGAGVGSAIGFLRAPIAFEIVRTFVTALSNDLSPALLRQLQASEQQARETVLAVPGASPGDLQVRRSARMRYAGQGHEIEVAYSVTPDISGLGAVLRESFESEYRRIFGQMYESAPVEATTWSVRVIAPRPVDTVVEAPSNTYRPSPSRVRSIYDGRDGEWREWEDFDRSSIEPGAEVSGPALVSESDTTTIIPAGFRMCMDGKRFLWITRIESTH